MGISSGLSERKHVTREKSAGCLNLQEMEVELREIQTQSGHKERLPSTRDDALVQTSERQANELAADDEQITDLEASSKPLLRTDKSTASPKDSDKEKKLAKHKSDHQLLSLGYIVLASFNLSLGSLCVKRATKVLHPQEVVFWRTVLTLAINMVMMKMEGIGAFVPPKMRRMLFLRCIAGYLMISLQFYAVSKMVLTEATVILFTSPAFTFLLGAIFLHEPLDRVDFMFALMAYFGVLFVVRPPFFFGQQETTKKRGSWLAVASSLGAALNQSITFVCMRKLKDLHRLVIMQYFILLSMVSSTISLITMGTKLSAHKESSDVVFAVIGAGLFACVGQFFLTTGFQYGNVGIGSIMRYFDVVFVFIWDVTLVGEKINHFSVIGGLIIGVSAISVALRRAWKAKV